MSSERLWGEGGRGRALTEVWTVCRLKGGREGRREAASGQFMPIVSSSPEQLEGRGCGLSISIALERDQSLDPGSVFIKAV